MKKRQPWYGIAGNDRTAARLRKTRWERCEFEDLVAGDVALFFEKDGTPLCEDGCYTVYIAEKPVKDDNGKWSLEAHTISDLAKYNPNKTSGNDT